MRTHPSGFSCGRARWRVGAADAVGAQLQGADYDVHGQVSSVLLGNVVQLEARRDVGGHVRASHDTRDSATVAEYY